MKETSEWTKERESDDSRGNRGETVLKIVFFVVAQNSKRNMTRMRSLHFLGDHCGVWRLEEGYITLFTNTHGFIEKRCHVSECTVSMFQANIFCRKGHRCFPVCIISFKGPAEHRKHAPAQVRTLFCIYNIWLILIPVSDSSLILCQPLSVFISRAQPTSLLIGALVNVCLCVIDQASRSLQG